MLGEREKQMPVGQSDTLLLLKTATMTVICIMLTMPSSGFLLKLADKFNWKVYRRCFCTSKQLSLTKHSASLHLRRAPTQPAQKHILELWDDIKWLGSLIFSYCFYHCNSYSFFLKPKLYFNPFKNLLILFQWCNANVKHLVHSALNNVLPKHRPIMLQRHQRSGSKVLLGDPTYLH